MKIKNSDSATSLQLTNNETSFNTTTKHPAIENHFGRFTVNAGGYYQCTSYGSENYGKYLHRLVWSETHNREIPENCDIHHINEDKTCNDPDNLALIERSFHRHLHTVGEKNPMFGKNHTQETKDKISKKLTKTEPRIIRNGHTKNGKQRYQLRCMGKVIMNSTDYEKLEKELKHLQEEL